MQAGNAAGMAAVQEWGRPGTTGPGLRHQGGGTTRIGAPSRKARMFSTLSP